jgi:radical SAM superfamily enzyme YgiQ (UPF0313 family)
MPNQAVFPVGIAYIAAALKKAGHSVDGMVFNHYDKLAGKLESKYDFVATGGLSAEYVKLKHISDIARKAQTKIIMGGGIITSEPELMSKALEADYSVIGEGEETVVELISCLEKGGNLSGVRGIGYFDRGDFKVTGHREQINDLDSIPWPDFDIFNYSQRLDSMKPTDLYNYDLLAIRIIKSLFGNSSPSDKELEEVLVPNLVFDKSATEIAHNEAMQRISPTKGKDYGKLKELLGLK